MRDDFSSKIKDILSKRVGLHCSNPKCRVLTIGPNSIEDKATNIGVASHITAASPNGPRYDASLSQKERSSIKNGIWLCQSCAKLIDSDPKRYPIEILSSWKVKAEKETQVRLTKSKKEKKQNRYDKIFKLMTSLIEEMKNDIESDQLIREFILLDKTWVYWSDGRKIFHYYYNDHEELDAKIKLLENNGLINDITYNNTKRYVFTEKFIEILINYEK